MPYQGIITAITIAFALGFTLYQCFQSRNRFLTYEQYSNENRKQEQDVDINSR